MILLDTNILSTFAKIRRLDLLEKIFEGTRGISPGVFEEISEAHKRGDAHAKDILQLLQNKKLQIITLVEEEKELANQLPASFGKGERDSIAYALRKNITVVTNERRVLNFCKRNKVTALSLNVLLRFLWEERILTKSEVEQIIQQIEIEDKILIPSKKEI